MSTLCLILSALASSQTKLAPEEIYERAVDSVVKIETTSDEGIAGGTGFFFGDERQVATAYHLIDGARSISVKGSKGTSWTVAEVVYNKSADVAILYLSDKSGRKAIAGRKFDAIKTGEEVFVLGNPAGLNFTFTKGIVSAQRKVAEAPFVQFDATAAGGSSGGPLLNSYGEVMGIVSFKRVLGSDLNMASSIDNVQALLDKPRTSVKDFYAEAGTTSKLKGAEWVKAWTASWTSTSKEAGKLVDRISSARLRLTLAYFRGWDVGNPKMVEGPKAQLIKALDTGKELYRLAEKFHELDSSTRTAEEPRKQIEKLLASLKVTGNAWAQSIADDITEQHRNPSDENADTQNMARQETVVHREKFFKQFDALLTLLYDQDWFDEEVFDASISDPVYAYTYGGTMQMGWPDLNSPAKAILAYPAFGVPLKAGDVIVGVKLISKKEFTTVKTWRDMVTFWHANKRPSKFQVKYRRGTKTVVATLSD